MSTAPLDIDGVTTASELGRQTPRERREVEWARELFGGRLCELSSSGASSSLTLTLELIRESQAEGEPVAWITAGASAFFPPDAIRNGIDLESLPVVRVSEIDEAARAADKLLRSGGFGLIVVDLGESGRRDEQLPRPLQKRLMQHAEDHDAAVLFLTDRRRDRPSLGSLFSLRAHTGRLREGGDRFICEVEALSDKRFGPAWSWKEVYRGPPGLR